MKQQPEYDPRGNLQKLFDRFSLSWRLMLDRRVDISVKFIPVAAVLYLLSPIDVIPELLLGPLGVVDDVGVVIMALELFIRNSPAGVVREHLEKLKDRFMDRMDGDEVGSDGVIEGQFRRHE